MSPLTPAASRWWEATWIAGPAAGGSARLDVGAHTLGRSTLASPRCDDRLLEPFHVRIEVIDSGELQLCQLAGRLPVTVDGRLFHGAGALAADRPHVVDVGASRLLLRPAPEPAAASPLQSTSAQGGRQAVVRAGRVVPTWEPAPVPLPQSDPPRAAFSGSLLPALLGLAGAGVIAVVLHQPLFLLFGALGAIVAIATWVAQRLGLLRSRRRSNRSAREAMEAFTAGLTDQRGARTLHHRTSVRRLCHAIAGAERPDATLWARRAAHPDAFTASLGVGEVRWQPVISGDERSMPPACWTTIEQVSTLPEEPVPVSLDPGSRIALAGPHGAAVAASLLAQLAVQTGPADWRLTIVTDDPDRWAHWSELPHGRVMSTCGAVTDEQGIGDLLRDGGVTGEPEAATPHRVLLVTDVRMLAARTSPVRRLLAAEPDSALLALVPEAAAVPAVCTALLATTVDGRASWTADTTAGDLPRPCRLTGLAPRDAATLVASLSRFVDPEDPASAGDALPGDVPLASLLPHTDPAGIAAAWAAAAPDAPPEAPVGLAGDGVVTIDLVRDGPHALLAGTTGAGKSELLRSLVVGLAALHGPDRINFVLVDYKGGAAFDVCAPLPHVVGVVTDLDGRLTERALRSLRAELTRREHLLRDLGAADLTAARAARGEPVLPRLVVVVDEFAAMAVEHRDLLQALIGIAQRGRSLGIHLVLATQRPTGVVGDDIRANTNLRVALRLTDVADSMDVIDDAAAAALPRTRPGRALMRLGPDELITFQSAHQTAALVPLVVEAARVAGIAAPPRPWCEPLPRELDPRVAGDGAIGVLDLPDSQRQQAWTWATGDGHVVVAGARGSGVTTTVLKAIAPVLDDTTELFVVDCRGDERWAVLAGHPRCAGVVRLHERERLIRLVARLSASPGGPTRGAAHRILVVDGIAALRLELEALELGDTRTSFERLLTDGSLGVTLIVATDSPASLPTALVSRCSQRWIHHLPDPHDALVLGVAAADVPATLIPGRVAVARGRDVMEAQVARLDVEAIRRRPRVPRVESVGTLPAVLDPTRCPRARRRDGMLSLPIGARFDDLTDARLEVADGEHVLVVGPGRSGRSTALVRVMQAWRTAVPDGWVGVVAPRRSPLSPLGREAAEVVAEVPTTGDALLVVDDAELVDDPSGSLARLVAARRAGLLIVVAGRPDALRAAYGHWSTGIRRSRLGIVMTGATDMDADLLGASLPRWPPLAARPGLGYVVADGTETLVQCAIDAAATPPSSSRRSAPARPRPLVAVS